MVNIEISDKHVAFAYMIAAGEPAYKAYLKHVTKEKITNASARSRACRLLKFPEIQDLVNKAREQRVNTLTKVNNEILAEKAIEAAEQLPPEFFGIALSVENLDQLHYSIIKGNVQVEAVYPVQRIEETVDERGRVIKRTKSISFQKVKRNPTIRERQASIDALYKRFGSYAPVKGAIGFGKLGPEDEAEGDVKRYIVLSNGEKIPFE